MLYLLQSDVKSYILHAGKLAYKYKCFPVTFLLRTIIIIEKTPDLWLKNFDGAKWSI